MDFVQSSDPCIYINARGEVLYIGIYVDEIILARETDQEIRYGRNLLKKDWTLNIWESYTTALG